ncbi:protein FAR1-RELATED SEQUENCE 5-like [Ipomoea triloba]|uniref:protein FAR1-RELATED SEQUENCE 5-like n=1 Tax=Ipomoea triloba TaxID=35885 RepID=UPI00125D0B85|nr:protein FAR1-RELATED SEQUENCE 5-like [Ipomoea triloba]XP_031112181.1 protein FAR1-RELATED SEQUENCE 5-like [Ipomoea triloba]
MRTTSRSEAENSVFGACINEHGTLLEFFTQFESAIELQRHKQARLDAECESSLPPTKTPLLIEKHATSVYTITMFYDVQTKIFEGCFACKITNKEQTDEKYVYTVKEGHMKIFMVKYVREHMEVKCSCGKFNRVGILCRHAFVVLKDNDAEMIPTKYVLDRWKKNSCIQETSSTGKGGSGRCSREEENSKLASKLCTEFYNYLALSKENTVKMQEMLTFMMENKEKMVTRNAKAQDKSKSSELLETFYGAQTSSIITVKPPQLSKNKGSDKRLKSGREKAVEKKKQDGRKCHYCGQKPARHDSRNCLLNPNSKENLKNKEKA